MKQFNPVPLENPSKELSDLENQIKDVSVYLQLSAQGQYHGAHAEHVVKLKAFLSSIRDQLITAYDESEEVKAKREALAKAKEAPKQEEADKKDS